VFENENYDDVIGVAPYITGLSEKCATAVKLTASTDVKTSAPCQSISVAILKSRGSMEIPSTGFQLFGWLGFPLSSFGSQRPDTAIRPIPSALMTIPQTG